MRARQHVVLTRLNDEEYEVFQDVLSFADRELGYSKNDSERFRKVLKVINKMLENYHEYYWWEHCTDF